MGNFERGSEWGKWDLQVQTILDNGYLQLKDYYESLKSSDNTKWEAFVSLIGGENNALLYDSKEYYNDSRISKNERATNYVRIFLSFIQIYQPDLSCIVLTDHNYYDDILIDIMIEMSQDKNCKILAGVEINVCGIHILVVFGKKSYGKTTYSETIKTFLSKIGIDRQKTDNSYTLSTGSCENVLKEIKECEAIPIFPHCNSDNGLFQERTRTDRTHLSNIYNFNKFIIIQSKQKEMIDNTIDYIKTKPNLSAKVSSTIASDARSLKDIGKADDSGNFCWIKADPTFEGLKQIIYEPDERVKIQQTKPEEKARYYVIDSIKLEEDKFWKQTIPLNSNLVTIIGGRSTGKSLLIGSISKKIVSSIDEIYNKIFTNEHIDIIWQDEEQTSNRDIDFFPQSYMYEIANDQKKTDELIEDIIKDKDEKKLLIAYYNFCDNNRTQLINKINTLFQLQSEIDKRNIEIKEKGDKLGVEKEIKLLEEKINKIHDGKIVTQDILIEYETINKNISEKEQLLQIIERDLRVIESLKTKNIFNPSIEYEFNSLSEKTRLAITNALNKVKEEAKTRWEEELAKQDSGLKILKESLFHGIKLEKEKETFKEGIKYFQENTQYQELQGKLKYERLKLSEISEIEISLNNLENQKQILLNEIIISHLNYYINVHELSKSLKFNCGGISIETSVVFKKDPMLSFFNERLNLRGTERQNFILDFINDYETNMFARCVEFLQLALNKEIDFKGMYSNKSQPTVASELLSTNWFDITYNLTYQKDVFSEMSQGKQAFVILKLLLEFSNKKCPILIDQPEDSLDNRAIYNELVTYLKDKKKERQIIIVTHNPNVVVGSDAEQVIVANQHGKDSKNKNSLRFQYVSGSLENTIEKDKSNKIILESQGIREHVCEILEGGKEAFEKRENKYGFKK